MNSIFYILNRVFNLHKVYGLNSFNTISQYIRSVKKFVAELIFSNPFVTELDIRFSVQVVVWLLIFIYICKNWLNMDLYIFLFLLAVFTLRVFYLFVWPIIKAIGELVIAIVKSIEIKKEEKSFEDYSVFKSRRPLS